MRHIQTGTATEASAMVLMFLAIWIVIPASVCAEWGYLPDMHDYHECFGLDPERTNYQSNTRDSWKLHGDFKVVMVSSNAPGNVFHELEMPEFTFQMENLTEEPMDVRGGITVIRYATLGVPGDNWYPKLVKLEDIGDTSIQVNLPAGGWQKITIRPPMGEKNGGYGFIVDLGRYGRQYLTSAVRTFKPDLRRVQHPKQSLEHMPPEILAGLGVQAVRYGISFIAPDEGARYNRLLERVDHDMVTMHENKVVCAAEIGAGTRHQPLGRSRPHLDEDDVMLKTKSDMAWLPEHDDEYEEFVYQLACKYGWPKGPITGFMLWNEPWEGLSISGWGADMLRYRELYKRMGDAVFRARRDAGVDVLIGGCDSSSNTWDKLFGEGIENSPFWPEYLDFCSIHYQGLSAPVLYPEWVNRKHYSGRVLIWDTESWTANTDDRFLGVVAANRAAGYDRALGSLSRIAVSTLSHHRTAYDTIHTDEGDKRIKRLIESRPLAAAYGAAQHFIGERDFREILYKTGLPWVFVFNGLDGNPDDGTVVVVGDLMPLFSGKADNILFRGVRSLNEVKAKQEIRHQIASLPRDAAQQRAKLWQKLGEHMDFSGATLSIGAGEDYHLYDYYGNPVPPEGDSILIPLEAKGFFLRANSRKPGSFAGLMKALRHARVDGMEPLDITAYDMLNPIKRNPVVRLTLTNQLNRAIEGSLIVEMEGLKLEYPSHLSFQPRERRNVSVRVIDGAPTPSNSYPLSVTFDAESDGIAIHDEVMHVNLIHHRTISVDGNLRDWQGALPQTINVTGSTAPSFTEAMWLPFQKVEPGQATGFAVGYMAYDDEYFYFAAKIADDTPYPGTVRFATRDDDQYFYPEVSYQINEKTGKKEKHVWPKGVRRFSYRRRGDLPSGSRPGDLDNVLIGFNALPIGEGGWLSHLPGRMPKFVVYRSADYEYALNSVAEQHGGGTEIWRLQAPGMPRKHFYPRQPEHPMEGPVVDGKLAIIHEGGVRVVECAIPWTEIPHVESLRDAGEPVKFSFRVNHNTKVPDMELPAGRSAAEGLSNSFHPDWNRHWPNELEFAFER